ncbi:MAG: helix-turn-helix transcriptional regulator [Blautia sp.]|jgi:predicted DNA-binding transcriptional regulator YafY
MKIDRLIGILSILLQQEKVTAPYLAEKYEVSRRTINRDIEALCKAGIPLVTTQGKNGGISIMDGYRIDKTLLTSADMQAILDGLKSLDSVSKTSRYQQLMEKLNPGSSVLPGTGHVLIDLSSWYKTTLAPKIETIQTAIQQTHLLTFTYFSPNSEGPRMIEPYYLVFQWASWYVWGYCQDRRDYRLFKLNRMVDLGMAGSFVPKQAPRPDFTPQRIYPPAVPAKVQFSPSMKWRLIEEYGIQSFEEQSDGSLLFCSDFPDENSLFSWLLSFGGQGELIGPPALRRHYQTLLERMLAPYKD